MGGGCLGGGGGGVQMMMPQGPGVDGPGPGVMGMDPMMMTPVGASQVAFVGPDGMVVNWDVSMPGHFDSDPLVCPGRYNFTQCAIYRLKLTNIPSRPGVELYPTIEVGPAVPRTAAFLAHNAIPAQFTEEDFDQVLSGNFVTKVLYLPDAEFQELASAGIETLVSTRLDPGVDPIVEADKRGAILAVIRLGNKDLEMPGEAPSDNVVPASYGVPIDDVPVDGGAAGTGAPVGMPSNSGWARIPQPYISGVTGPEYGMPYCGTPIGLPGPPHIPLGYPAGLKKHVIKNRTPVHVPYPAKKISVAVREKPGVFYPKSITHGRIVERACAGGCPTMDCPVTECTGEGCPIQCDDASCDSGIVQ
ncbi:MAG: hypothetical protein JXM70_18290 [Pirellulales bacterium]|nr:hypothetical protein [Pirellulales bacterium]